MLRIDPVKINATRAPVPVDRSHVRRTARTALQALGRPRHVVSMALVDDRMIRDLNRRYLGKNRPTDVLAFPMEVKDAPTLPAPLLGEVVVSVETAQRQAREHGHSLREELDLLVIHGLLHLVGYDDQDPIEARLMHDREMEILGRIYACPVPSLRVAPARLSQEARRRKRRA